MDQSEAARIFAAMGGRAKSKAKAAAARANGKKGGRPKGSKNKPRP
jgi:hypothetical protein